MGSPSEMDAPSKIFFCLFDTISGCLIQSPNNFVGCYIISSGLEFGWLIFAELNAT